MKRRIIAFLLVVSMVLLIGIGVSYADTNYSVIPECSCGNEKLILERHADGCDRKAYCREVSKLSAKELYDMWRDFPEDIRTFVLTYLGWTNWSKQQELQELLRDFVDEPEDSLVEEVQDGCVCKPKSTYGSIKHKEQCPYHFANLTIEEEYIVYITLNQTEQANAIATLDADKKTEFENYLVQHPYAHTVSSDGVSVTACDVPYGATVTAEVVDKETTEAILPSITLANQAEFVLDIKVYDINGNEYQPNSNEPVMVKVSMKETKTGDKTDFVHILDTADAIERGIADGSVKLLDISYLFEEEREDGTIIEVTPELPKAYWAALSATQQLGYEKKLAYEIVTGTCVDDGYSTFYLESFSMALPSSLSSGTYYIGFKLDDATGKGVGAVSSSWKGYYPSKDKDDSKLMSYHYTEIGSVTIPAGNTVNLIFVTGDIPITGTINVHGTLNASLYDGSTIKFWKYRASGLAWNDDKSLVQDNIYFGYNSTIYRSSQNGGHIFSVSSSGTLNLSGHHSVTPFIIDGKNVANAGSAIVSSGNVNLDYVTINNNHKSSGGGAILLQGSSANTLDYVNINNCTSTSTGGAIHMTGSCAATLNSVNINGCTAKHAGGIYTSSSGNLTFNSSSITNCTATANGGGMYLGGTGTINVSSSTISGCKASNDGVAVLIITDDGSTTFKKSKIHSNEYTGTSVEQLGGTIRSYGGSTGTKAIALFEECEIYNNKGGQHGGGLYWNAGRSSTLTIRGCKIYNNSVVSKGGGVFCESVMSIEGATEIYGNTAYEGGGICVNAYGGSGDYTNMGCDLTMSSAMSIRDNKATGFGGGISMNVYDTTSLNENASFIIKLNGAQINNNQAPYGGGIRIYRNTNAAKFDCEVDLDFGEFKNNVATSGNGGGVYTENVDVAIGNTAGKTMTISGNQATNGIGGAVYSTGTMGSCTVTNGTLTANSAKSGGAIGITSGLVSVSGGAISQNTVTNYGGGIYASGTNAGVTVSGNGSISSNQAANGGGVYATGGAFVNVTGGSISYNSAKGSPNVTTAYNDKATSGVGGGIYVGNGTSSKSSSISLSGSSAGLYGNTADFAAADAYTSGTYTIMSLPKVQNMNLTGYSGSATGWYEDYATGDSGYANGLKGSDAGERYAKARNTVEVTSSSNITKYAAITLGTTRVGYGNLTIQKSGIDVNPNQIFLFQVTGNGISMEVSVQGTEPITIYGLPDGTYTVKEVKSWSWRYTPASESISATISGTNVNPTVTFNNTLTNRNWLSILFDIINVKG